MVPGYHEGKDMEKIMDRLASVLPLWTTQKNRRRARRAQAGFGRVSGGLQ